jgi:hypothetical protein
MSHVEKVVAGTAVEFSGKAQRKPIELLTALLTPQCRHRHRPAHGCALA